MKFLNTNTYSQSDSNRHIHGSKPCDSCQLVYESKVDLEGFEPSAVSGPLSAFTNVIPIKPNAVRGYPNYGVPNCCQNVGRHPLASDGDSYG